MFYLLSLFIVDALSMSSAHFYGKTVMSRGVEPKTYVYAINIGLFICSIPLAILFLELPDFTVFILVIIFLSALVRGINLLFFAKGLNTLSAMEMTAVISISTVITYAYDVIFNPSVSFQTLAFSFILVVISGALIMSKGRVGFRAARLAILIVMLTQVTRGILGNIAMAEMNSVTYLFLMTGVTVAFLIPFSKFFNPSTFAFIEGIKVQVLGTIGFVVEMILAKESATLFMLASPAIMISTILLTLVFKKSAGFRPDRSQFLGMGLIILGMVGYIFTTA